MGLFDFVKDAGEKIFNRDEARAAEAAAENQAAEQARKEANVARANALTKVIDGMGLGVETLAVQVDGPRATIFGKAPSQEAREKVILLAGNVEGIQQVDDRMTVETPEPEATMYTVVAGDSLSKIAKAHYGDGSKYMAIFEANKPMLKDPNKIYPGQTLRIPPLS